MSKINCESLLHASPLLKDKEKTDGIYKQLSV